MDAARARHKPASLTPAPCGTALTGQMAWERRIAMRIPLNAQAFFNYSKEKAVSSFTLPLPAATGLRALPRRLGVVLLCLMANLVPLRAQQGEPAPAAPQATIAPGQPGGAATVPTMALPPALPQLGIAPPTTAHPVAPAVQPA
ncbi:MAG: hypothetical protein K2X84_11635, partial [Beijerinckiaceae bacterium]|nr:hypothetical protein [Beijerinckiaceae bacterium]